MIKKLKSFLFEQEEMDNNRSPRRGGRRSRDRNQNVNEAEDANDVWAGVLLASLVVIVLFILIPGDKSEPQIDQDLCPSDKQYISSKTYILMDFSEPLSGEQQNELKNLIKAAAKSLKKRERLTISRMEPNPNSPRKHVRSLCNPVDLDGIEDAVGRTVDIDRDCPAIIARDFPFHPGVGETTRVLVRDTCQSRSDLDENIKRIIKESVPSRNPEQLRSYIVGSIEDIMIEADGEPRGVPTRLIVFSDMVQHADWFSQYRNDYEEWTVENLSRQRENNIEKMGARPEYVFSEVLLCYQSNGFIGDSARRQKKHKEMWEKYFERARIFKPVDSGGCTGVLKDLMDAK